MVYNISLFQQFMKLENLFAKDWANNFNHLEELHLAMY